MTPPPVLKENACPYCGYIPAKGDMSWWTFDYVTMVAGPCIEIVGKCTRCHGKFIVSSEPMRLSDVPTK